MEWFQVSKLPCSVFCSTILCKFSFYHREGVLRCLFLLLRLPLPAVRLEDACPDKAQIGTTSR